MLPVTKIKIDTAAGSDKGNNTRTFTVLPWATGDKFVLKYKDGEGYEDTRLCNNQRLSERSYYSDANNLVPDWTELRPYNDLNAVWLFYHQQANSSGVRHLKHRYQLSDGWPDGEQCTYNVNGRLVDVINCHADRKDYEETGWSYTVNNPDNGVRTLIVTSKFSDDKLLLIYRHSGLDSLVYHNHYNQAEVLSEAYSGYKIWQSIGYNSKSWRCKHQFMYRYGYLYENQCSYYYSGKQAEITGYTGHNSKHGSSTLYYDCSLLDRLLSRQRCHYTCHYKDNQLHGSYTLYGKDGKIQESGNYEDTHKVTE